MSEDEWFYNERTLISKYNIKLARSPVLKSGSSFSMWYSHVDKNEKSQLGFATSTDLIVFEHQDHLISKFPFIPSVNNQIFASVWS